MNDEGTTTSNSTVRASPKTTATDSPTDIPGKSTPIRTGPNRKRPFPNTRKEPNKRAKASFSEPNTARQIATTTPLYTAYELETSFRGIILLCNTLYAILTNRDHKISTLITADDLQYVTLLSIIYRAQLIASQSTTTIVRNLSYLKETVADMLLPDVLCQYIESIGYIKLSSGITVIPYIRDYAVMRNTALDFIDPAGILVRMGDDVPDTPWAISDTAVLRYKQAISRVLKNALQLRKVNNTELEAKPEFLASYKTQDNGKLTPLTFEISNVNQAQLGAVYKFRSSETFQEWDGLRLPLVCEAADVSPEHYLTDYILHLLKGEHAK